MESNRLESAKWSQATSEVVEKLEDGVGQALAKNAGKGFAAPTGEILESILDAGQEAKGKLTDANGKIYDEQRAVFFQVQEFTLKVLVRIAKLALEAYRDKILNALTLETAQLQADTEHSRADVDRLNAETESRQIAIIRARAEIEHSINAYRQQVIDAEYISMGAEELLIQAQLATAEKKLEIINSIYQVLAAEELVLAAEQRRAASLEKVLEAQRILAAIKEQMVPFYIDKAHAREELAVAVGQDALVRAEIERLGYDKLDLKYAEETADRQIREATEEYELADSAYTRARMAVRLFRSEKQRLLQEYTNQVHESILAKKKALEEDGIDFKLRVALARQGIGLDNETTVLDHERGNLTLELSNLLNNMEEQAMDQALVIRESAQQVELNIASTVANFRRIVKG